MAKDLVFSDVALEDEPITQADFQQRLLMSAPAGYSEFRPLFVADYEYEKAIIRTNLMADSANRPALEALNLTVDVPDVIDRGIATLTGFPLTVLFSRSFHQTPEVIPFQKAGAVVATPRVTALSPVGFQIDLIDGSGASVAGVVSWAAVGF